VDEQQSAARSGSTTVPVAASGEAVSHEEGTAAHSALAVFLAGGSPAALRRGVFIVLAGVICLSLTYWAFFAVRSFLLLLILAWFAAIAMEPAVSWMAAKGLRRGAGTGIVFLSLLLLLVGFSVAFGSLLVSQLSSLVTNLPDYAEDTILWVNKTFNTDLDATNIQDSLNLSSDDASVWATRIAQGALGFVTSFIGLIFQGFTLILFTFYFSAEGPRFRRFIASLFPTERQHIITMVWETAVKKTGGYMVSRLVLAIISATFTCVFLALIDVPYWLPLGIWVGVISQFIPTVGTYLGGALPVLIALLNDPIDALWVILFVLGYQQLENYFFSPRISSRTMQIHPAVAFGAVIVGGSMFGPWGALVSIPAVASLQALFDTYGKRYELADEEDKAAAEKEDAERPDAEAAEKLETDAP